MKRFSLIVLLGSTLALGQTTRPVFSDLVGKLTSPDWQERQAAEDALVGLGGDAIDPINELLDGSIDFETRERLRSAMARISRDQLLLATRVTIDKTFNTPQEAFSALAAAVSVNAEPANEVAMQKANEARPVVVKIDKMPWLAAVEYMIATTNLHARIEESRIVIMPDAPTVPNPQGDVVGALFIYPENTRKRLQMDLSVGKNNSGTVTMRLVAQTEPKVKFVDNGLRMVVRQMTDDKGQPFGANDVTLQISRERDCRYGATLQLGSAAKLPQTISTLQGEMIGELITRFDETRISDFSTLPKTINIPDAEIELVSVKPKNKTWEMVLELPQFARNSMLVQQLSRGQTDSLKVLDQNDHPMRIGNGKVANDNATVTITMTLSSNDPQQSPKTLIWTTPAQTREVRIPFELKNLQMPD